MTGPSIPRLLGIENSKVKQVPGGWNPVEVHSEQILSPAPANTYPLPKPSSTGNGAATEPSLESTTEALELGSDGIQQAPTAERKVGALYAMSLAFLLADRGTAIVWRGPKKTAMIRQFLSTTKWPAIDYLLIDTPPGTSDEHISLVETLLKDISAPTAISTASATDARDATTTATATGEAPASASSGPQLSGAVIVTTPQAVAVSDVRKELNFCAKTGVRIIGVVENMSGYVCPCCGEETNLFSKAGGQAMAEEFGVPFLGAVPVDPHWGVLVEQGKRPVYNSETAAEIQEEESDSEDDDADAGRHEEPEEPQEVVKEEGLLVDKYRNCSLCPAFAAITHKVVKTAEAGAAVAVNKV